MKVYQLIYTSVRHSLSDSTLGLANQPGLRVYSCSQGITENNIAEIVKFASYRLPKNDKTVYSEVTGDPQVPEMFPKCFRTLRLSDGRYAAIQTVFAGMDYQGQPGNFFAHALVFDEPDAVFFPERYFKSSAFKTCLTAKEAEKEIVHYLPQLDGLKPEESTDKRVKEFIASHKKEVSYLLDAALEVLTSETVKHMCISTSSEETTENYLLSLKWLLPRDISMYCGISTYNIYIPSDRQRQIVFNGTIKGKNNITKQSIDTRGNCMYIDMDTADVSQTEESELLGIGVDALREEYSKYGFSTVVQFKDWLATRRDITKPGMGAKLLAFKTSAGGEAFGKRVSELYDKIDDEDMRAVRFEILKVAYDNIEWFENKSDITEKYFDLCIDKLCDGENYDLYDLFGDGTDKAERAELLRAKIPDCMAKIKAGTKTAGSKNTYIFLSLLAQIKNESGGGTWKEFFKNDADMLTTFTEMASMIITGYGVHAFTPPSDWTQDDLDETVVYFDSSTRDDKVKESCLRYIIRHDETDWGKYGITFVRHKKTPGEQAADMRRLKRMLKKTGYIPYQNNSYTDLRHEVSEDMYSGIPPLLLSRLLDAYYQWRSAGGNQSQSEKKAEKLCRLILELKKTEKSCYNYIFPKLGLEIAESSGHFHEKIINTETMPPSFWNWFVIGFERSEGNDDKILNYTRIFEANKRKLLRMSEGKHVINAFRKTGI